MVMSHLLRDGAPYTLCCSHGFVCGEGGRRGQRWGLRGRCCRCYRPAILDLGGELVRADPKLVRKKSSGDLLRLGQHVRVGQHVWSGQLVWRSLVRDVCLGAVCCHRFIGGYPVLRMAPAVNRCLPFALEDYAWVNYCCRSGTAVFTESIAVSRPFVSDVSLAGSWSSCASAPCSSSPCAAVSYCWVTV